LRRGQSNPFAYRQNRSAAVENHADRRCGQTGTADPAGTINF
jgi:hypothetical protein